MSTAPRPFHNLVLKGLAPETLAKLAPFLVRVPLALRDTLERPGQPIDFVYFFETALASVVARAGSEEVEVAICGRDGLSGLAVVNGTTTSPLSCFIQGHGDAYRIATADLVPLLQQDAHLRRVLSLVSQANMIQVAYTALANGRYSILQRMSRWILMCHDRLDGDNLELTHSFLSLMLGVRRAGVTTDMHVLEGAHAIVNRRGRIMVRDRAKLEAFAGECYGVPEAEYERLLGQKLRREAVAPNEP